MASEMQRFGTSEDDDDEMGLDVKEEGENDEDDDEKGATMSGGVDGGAVRPRRSNKGFQRQQQFQDQFQDQMSPQGGGGGGRRCRPSEEKERTKLRERQRRAITAKILAGLRRHGNYNLRVRADINDVIAALAREAGWVVLPDGTTFPSRSQGARPAAGGSTPVLTPSTSLPPQQNQAASLGGISSACQIGIDDEACQMKGLFVPSSSAYDVSSSGRSHSSNMLGVEVDGHDDPLMGVSVDTIDARQVVDMPSNLQEQDFAGTPYVPVYVLLPLGVINMKCELADPDSLLKQLRVLKSINVDGVMVDCWWGIVEAHEPQEYNWKGYKRLFQMVRELKLKLQVVMSFHECGGNVADDVCIPLPHWVAEIGRNNPDIYFTDRSGRRNPECLSWGVDKERVLRGRTALEVYFDYMRSFRVEFDEFFVDGVISMIGIGLGPSGELRYPSNPVKHGWRYPGVGEFQCYDQYMMKSLTKAAEARGHPFWARGPENGGSYNSRPHETGFFCDGGDYDSYYGRFFLDWYSQLLISHGDRVLTLAKLAFEGICITTKLSGYHWWYKTASHAAELAAGFYNPSNRDGYAAIVQMLKKHGVTLNFRSAQMSISDPHMDSEAFGDPDGLAWQVTTNLESCEPKLVAPIGGKMGGAVVEVMNAAWDSCIPITSENDLPCLDKVSYNHLLEKAKPPNDPDGRHYSAFTYLRLGPHLMEPHNIMEFERFVKRMHGEAVFEIDA